MSDDETPAWTLRRFVLAVVVVVAIAMLAQAAFNGGSEVSGDIALNATDGPEVTFRSVTTNVNLTSAFPDDSTVEWTAGNGNITLSASGQTPADVDQITGTWTNLSSLGMSATALSVDPEDKQRIEVANATALSFRDVTLDDGVADLDVTTTGTAELTVTDLSVDGVAAINSSGGFVAQGPVSGGTATLELDESDTMELIEYEPATPGLSNPAPEGDQDDFPTQVSVEVDDPNFPNDEVTVDFTVDGSPAGSDTLTSAGTASTSISQPSGGETTVTATATDDAGNTQTLSWTFSSPDNLTIRDATNPDRILDNRIVNATFFQGDDITSRQTTDGKISMSGLGVDNTITVSVDAQDNANETPSSYHSVEDLILDITQQTDIYLVPTTASTRTVRFTLDDRSGGVFTDNGESVIVQKPVNQSGWSSPRWETVFADEFGPEGATATLEDGQRYRIIVRNDDGDERVLGAYSADADETVVLEVGQLNAVPEGDGREFAWNATYAQNQTVTSVQFEYNDSEDRTDRIYIEIYEYNNETNVLSANQSFGGPYGNFSFTEPVPSDQENVTWTVDVTIQRGDEQITIQEPVGPQNPILETIPTRFKVIISIGTILLVGGLFSQLNGAYGGLIMAGLGGIFWYIDFLPPGTGIGVVVLAMIVAAVIFIRERQVSGI